MMTPSLRLRHPSRPVLAAGCAALMAAAVAPAPALARGVNPPSWTVQVNFNALVIRSDSGAPGYHLFPGIQVSGFTDEMHPDNFGRVRDEAEQFIGSTNQGSSSVVFSSVADLRDTLVSSAGWRVVIVDGATGLQYDYTFTLDATALVNDHMRALTFTNVAAGDTISTTPTFTWDIVPYENPGNPATAFDIGVGNLIGPTPIFDVIPPASTSWTPPGPILPGPYQLAVQLQGTGDASFMVPTTPQPAGFEPPLSDFTWSGTFGTYASVSNLNAATPPACPGDLNNDAQRDTADLVRFLGQFGQTCGAVTPPCADFNNDGTVNTLDLTFFLARFGVPCP